jgi:predicted deacylase
LPEPDISRDEYPRGATRLWSDIDIDREGRTVGYLRLNHSTHEHGGAWIPIPVAVFRNGPGPRVLLTGGVHGDEYEGQVMLMKLIRTLQVSNVRGHLIILPATNAPAVYAGRRTSPIDGGNLNRLFPGDPNGTPTQAIAHYIESVLLPKVEYLFDFHSGGSASEYMPSAHVYYSEDDKKFAQAIRFLEVFGMPTSIVLKGLMGKDQKIIGACERNGVLRFSSELGGASRVNVDAVRRAEHGLARLLYEVGALKEPITDEPAPPIRLLRRLPQRQYVYAMASGVFEPFWELGQSVRAGQPAGAIHFPEAPWREPEIATFPADGTVYAMRPLARTILGDMLFILAVPWES